MSDWKQLYEIDLVKTGLKLKQLRKEHNLSVSKLKMIIGCSCVQTIYCWERGRVLPSVYHLFALANLYGMHIDDLIVTYDPADQCN